MSGYQGPRSWRVLIVDDVVRYLDKQSITGMVPPALEKSIREFLDGYLKARAAEETP